VRAGKPRLGCVDAPEAPQGAGDGRHLGLVAIIADAHRDAFREIDTLEIFEKTVDEMLARLLAIADDVNPGILLKL
jgi:hypothetical protein